MLVEYAATEMGFLDYYSDADPNDKSIRGNGITTFLFHVAQCILFCLTNCVKTILIANASLKTFYSRLGFTVIKDFMTSTTSEAARSRFHYETGKSKAEQKKISAYSVYTLSHDELDFFMTIELTSIYIKMCSDIQMVIQHQKLGFLNKYIEDEIKKKVDKTRDQLASDEMAYAIRQYIGCIKHDTSQEGRIKNNINKLLFNREYIDFFIQIYIKWSSDNSIECMPHLEKMALSQFKVYIEAENDSMYCVQQP